MDATHLDVIEFFTKVEKLIGLSFFSEDANAENEKIRVNDLTLSLCCT